MAKNFDKKLTSLGEKVDVVDRTKQNSRRATDEPKDFSVGLFDIDAAIKYYFNNVIRPKVLGNENEIIPVPTQYANPERWKSAQRDGYLRDDKGKLQIPFIAYRRTNIEKSQAIPVDKIDRNVTYTVKKKWNPRGRYEDYNTQVGLKPSYEYYVMAIPDYVNIRYDMMIFTDYIEQMNPIVQDIIYNEGAYWGDKNRFKFKCTIDNYDTNIEVPVDEDRIVKTNFSITLNGYLIPESVNNTMNSKKFYTMQKLYITTETDTALESTVVAAPSTENKSSIGVSRKVTTTSLADDVIARMKAYNQPIFDFLSLQTSKTATSVISDNGGGYSTAIFGNATTASIPTGLTGLSASNFMFYVNGQEIEHSAIESAYQSGSSFYLNVYTGSLGFSFESTDEIIGVGKFNP